MGGGIVRVTLVVVFGRFGLTLFEGVDEIGLGDGLETEKRNAESGGGGDKSRGAFFRDAFCICSALVATGTQE